MRSTKITRTEDGKFIYQTCGCPYKETMTTMSVIECRLQCSRFIGIKAGYIMCGVVGSNKGLPDRQPTTHDLRMMVYGDNLDYVVATYGKPKGI